MLRHARNACVCLVGATIAALAQGQPREPVIVDIARCVDVTSALERLDCYDELARAAARDAASARGGPVPPQDLAGPDDEAGSRPAAAPAVAVPSEQAVVMAPTEPVTVVAPTESVTEAGPGESAAAPAPVATADADAAADRFGFPEESARERRRGRDREPVDEITSEVAALREIVPGQLEITLTNGQVWRQTNSDRYRLQVGYPVRVYPSRFGQYYRLTSEIIRGFVQVERVR